MSVKPSSTFIKTAARLGLAAKGIIYCMLGTLTLMSALNMGGDEADKNDVFDTILDQPMGRALLVVLVAGLLCYVAWRFLQAALDTEDKGTDKKGIAARIGYAFSGLLYCGITLSAIHLLMNSGDDGGSTQQQVSELMSKPFGKFMVLALGLLVIGRGIFQLYIAFSGKLEKRISTGAVGKWVLNTGKFGYTCRAIVLGMIGYFLLMAGLHANPGEAADTKRTFSVIEMEYGNIWLCIIAAGLAIYGLYMFVEARYRRINT